MKQHHRLKKHDEQISRIEDFDAIDNPHDLAWSEYDNQFVWYNLVISTQSTWHRSVKLFKHDGDVYKRYLFSVRSIILPISYGANANHDVSSANSTHVYRFESNSVGLNQPGRSGGRSFSTVTIKILHITAVVFQTYVFHQTIWSSLLANMPELITAWSLFEGEMDCLSCLRLPTCRQAIDGCWAFPV